MITKSKVRNWIKPMARFGLISKGVVYCLVGLIAFMAAFELNGQSTEGASKEGVIHFIKEKPGGIILLGIVAVGLLCFSIWRLVQGIADTKEKGSDAKGLAVRGRYIFSGLVYLSLTALAIREIAGKRGSSENETNQEAASTIINQPFGQWLLGILALILIGVGVYQAYFGLSGKYRKYVSGMHLSENAASVLLRAGQIGYLARGFVWLIIGYLFMRAAIHGRSKEAGDSADAFEFLKDADYGPYLLGAVGIGLICYGVFNFVRARYDNFRP